MLNDFCIFSLKNFLLVLASLRVVEQRISSFISLTLAIIDAEMVAGQLLGLVDLVEAQILCIYKLTQIVMIGQYQDFILAAFKVVALILKRIDNG